MRAVFRFYARVQPFAFEIAFGPLAVLAGQATFKLAEAVSHAILGAALLVRGTRSLLAILIEIDDIAHDAPPPDRLGPFALSATEASD
jgi:hypothetical protein